MGKEVISLSVLVAVASLGAVPGACAKQGSGPQTVIVNTLDGQNDVGDQDIVTDHSRLIINDDHTTDDITNDYASPRPTGAGWSNANTQREDMLQEGGDIPITVGVANPQQGPEQNAAYAATSDINQ